MFLCDGHDPTILELNVQGLAVHGLRGTGHGVAALVSHDGKAASKCFFRTLPRDFPQQGLGVGRSAANQQLGRVRDGVQRVTAGLPCAHRILPGALENAILQRSVFCRSRSKRMRAAQGYLAPQCRDVTLRTCSRSPKQKSQESEMDELQTGIEMSLAVFP